MVTYSTTAGTGGEGFATTSTRSYSAYGSAIESTATRSTVTLGALEGDVGLSDSESINHRAGYGMTSTFDVVEFDPSGFDGFAVSTTRAYSSNIPENDPTSAYIPQGDFRRVQGRVVDKAGEPITEALWLVAQDALSTAARVNDDALFEINLLRVNYEDFALLVDSPEPDMNYVWYTAVDYTLEPGMNGVTIAFERAQPESGGGGLFAGTGVSMG